MAIPFARAGRWSAWSLAVGLVTLAWLPPNLARSSDVIKVEVSVDDSEKPIKKPHIEKDSGAVTATSSVSLDQPTHRQIRTLKPQVDGQTAQLKTFVVDPKGRILACVGGLTDTAAKDDGDEAKTIGGVLVMNEMGVPLEWWVTEFTPGAIAITPSGEVFVAGDGKLVKLSEHGDTLATVPLPHIKDAAKLREDVEKQLRESLVQQRDMFGKQIETLQERIAKIEKVDEKDRDRLQNAQLTAFKKQLEMYESMGLVGDDNVTESQIESAIAQAIGVTSMAASDEDIFFTVSGSGGGGYTVWRINQDLDEDSARLVRKGFSGCCGQMDIQCDGEQLIVSENTKFRVAFYDREGEPVSHFGKRDSSSKDGFGSCCNPMNCCPLPDGTVLTAESSIGHIKKFDREGNCVAYIGKASIGGGCKHCSLGFDAAKDLYYMMSEDAGEICVLGSIASHPLTEAEKSLATRGEAFLKSIAGTWSIPVEKPADESKSAKKGRIGEAVDSLLGTLVPRRSRSAPSNLPLTQMTVSQSGKLSGLEGMYASLGSSAELRPKFATDTASDAPVPIAIAMDQAEYLQGTWQMDKTGHATLTFRGFPAIKLARSDSDATTCPSTCGESCAGEACEAENCPNKATAESAKPASPVVASMTSDGAVEFFSQPLANDEREMLSQSDTQSNHLDDLFPVDPRSPGMAAPSVVWEYRVIGPKKLGGRKAMEASLNELGAEGWEYCGLVESQMMFKRARASK